MSGSGEFGAALPLALIAHTLDVISVLAPDGTILFESPTVHRWTGWLPAELQGRNGFELIHPDDLPAVRQAFAACLASPGGQATATYRLRHKDGGWRWIESLGTNQVQDPQIGGIVLSSRDVTERRTLDDQLRHAQKMDAVGRLAGGVAHDFNNLLTAILGYTALLENDLGADHPGHARAHEIRRAAERAAALTRQLLAFSRRAPAEARLVRVDAVVADLDRMLHRLIGEEIELVTSLAAEHGRVLIDPGRLEQVVVNLVVNARDAMPHGGHLQLSTAYVRLHGGEPRSGGLRPGSYISLAVSDDGEGMDETVMARLFEPFFTTKAPGRGTGLGLSVIWGIVHEAGGTVLVDSRPGRGSTFTVLLPLGQTGPEPSPLRTPLPIAAGGSGETILLAEDEPAVRSLLNQALSSAGYRVLVAADGEAALELSGGHGGPIDLLLTDVVMPRLGGVDLAAQLRRRRPGLRVLFMTGYSDAELSDEQVLPKPFAPSLVIARVRHMLLHRG
jgi:two-component system cell cycle sensor histidine kinase/response regulator CckA